MEVRDLGRMGYSVAWEVQKAVAEEVANGGPDVLLFVEHPPVLTLGANFHGENLLFTVEQYRERGIEVITTDRGGDVTYHGPGQLVIYPIFDLRRHGKDVHKWLRDLEETMILTLAEFGFESKRFPPHTGAWVGDLKVAAIGVKIKRWVSLHGIALNCDNSLEVFGTIVPCGIQGYGVTSLTELMAENLDPRSSPSSSGSLRSPLLPPEGREVSHLESGSSLPRGRRGSVSEANSGEEGSGAQVADLHLTGLTEAGLGQNQVSGAIAPPPHPSSLRSQTLSPSGEGIPTQKTFDQSPHPKVTIEHAKPIVLRAFQKVFGS